ncbi:hypothetical protein [Streptomyces sioyaensis]|uniref:hypothetical protein n=1 Tax=Streptomyces sioyaensis TaxID=67364 RepID=UPI0037B95D3B
MNTETTHDFALLSAISSAELPEDLKQRSKAGVPRKVSRLLERAFYAPFVAAIELADRAKTIDSSLDLERFALFTVSNWDPSIPIPDFAVEDDPNIVQRLSHFYTHPANPTDWLRRMPNNPLCNIAITTGFRGPTMHYTGGADSLSLLSTVALSTLANGSASAAMIVAFDLAAGEEHLLAEEGDSAASAVLLGARQAGTGEEPVAADLAGFTAAAAPGTTAVAALDAFIAHSRTRTAEPAKELR